MSAAAELQCRVVASREPSSRVWEFALINDGRAPIESATLEAVKYEWGDQYWGGEAPGVRVEALAPGGRAPIWRDDGDSEMRTDLWLRVRHGGVDTWLLFEFPKLYRQTATTLARHATIVNGPPDP
jgi:hypothetical protein